MHRALASSRQNAAKARVRIQSAIAEVEHLLERAESAAALAQPNATGGWVGAFKSQLAGITLPDFSVLIPGSTSSI